ncbi:hypothetical protein Bca4012_031414 [Brassica carinata]
MCSSIILRVITGNKIIIISLQQRELYTDAGICRKVVRRPSLRDFSEKCQYVGVWVSEITGRRHLDGNYRENAFSENSSVSIVGSYQCRSDNLIYCLVAVVGKITTVVAIKESATWHPRRNGDSGGHRRNSYGGGHRRNGDGSGVRRTSDGGGDRRNSDGGGVRRNGDCNVCGRSINRGGCGKKDIDSEETAEVVAVEGVVSGPE